MNPLELNYIVENDDFLNMGNISDIVRSKLKEMGYSPEIVRRVSTVLYQGEINMLIHAGGGKISITIDDSCITMVLEDKGPGIEDIEAAMKEGYSTADSKARSHGFGEGMGLSSMKQFSDEMQIYSEPEVGTTVIMKVFAEKQ